MANISFFETERFIQLVRRSIALQRVESDGFQALFPRKFDDFMHRLSRITAFLETRIHGENMHDGNFIIRQLSLPVDPLYFFQGIH